MHKVPFIAFIGIVPHLGSGKKFEKIIDRQKQSKALYDVLKNDSDLVLPEPGGDSWGSKVDNHSLSTMSYAFATSPDFGEYPNMIIINGFINNPPVDPHGRKTIIHAGKVVTIQATGSKGFTPEMMPPVEIQQYAKSLKDKIENAIDRTKYEVIKIDYSGVAFGHNGLHFLP